MGPPGAGKGTQAKRVAARLNVPAISTGEIFRENVTSESELGRKAKSYMEAGDYVPDEITNAMVRDRIAQPDAADGFLLDGYPRTVAQVAELDLMVQDSGHEIDAVLVLTVRQDEVVGRLLQRAQDEGRVDDTEEVIRHRQKVYADQTAPLIEVYDERGLLVEVDGMGRVEDVTSRIFDALERTNGAAAS